MKAKMTLKYRGGWIVIAAVALLLAFFGWMSVIALRNLDEDSALGIAALCLLFFAVILVAVYFRFNYGIKISEKRVIAFSQTKVRILRYENVSSITVEFTNTEVVAYIKTMEGKEHTIAWSDLDMDNLTQAIIIDKEFVEKSIDSLSKCPRVKIRNRYKQKEQNEDEEQ